MTERVGRRQGYDEHAREVRVIGEDCEFGVGLGGNDHITLQ